MRVSGAVATRAVRRRVALAARGAKQKRSIRRRRAGPHAGACGPDVSHQTARHCSCVTTARHGESASPSLYRFGETDLMAVRIDLMEIPLAPWRIARCEFR